MKKDDTGWQMLAIMTILVLELERNQSMYQVFSFFGIT